MHEFKVLRTAVGETVGGEEMLKKWLQTDDGDEE